MRYLIIIGFLIFFSCQNGSKIATEIEAIPMEVEVQRFDKLFANATLSELPKLKQDYPFFFPSQFADSIWEQRLADTLQIQLNEAVAKSFPSEAELETELESLFKHITYYFPEFEAPSVYTTTSDVDYRTKIIATDSLLIIELDTYLGVDHPFYSGIPKYISKNLTSDQILPDAAAALSKPYINPGTKRYLLAQLIYYGKQLYLKKLWLPETPVHTLIGYTEEEWNWAVANETEIWTYFIENELLYSTSPKLLQRFITPAPFSKFNLPIDNESPGRIGHWLGWQMIESYMKNNAVTPQELMEKSADEIYKQSKYKPQK